MKLLVVGISAFILVAGAVTSFAHEVPELLNPGEYPYERVFIIKAPDSPAKFKVILRAQDQIVLDHIDQAEFQITEFTGRESREVLGDVQLHNDVSKMTSPTTRPGLYIILEPVGKSLPMNFEFRMGTLPLDDIANINAGHYQSEAVRNYAYTSSYAWFYHVHCLDGCGEHVLYQGSFVWCTYAYDCYAGHAIRGVRIRGNGNYAIQYGTYCWEARC